MILYCNFTESWKKNLIVLIRRNRKINKSYVANGKWETMYIFTFEMRKFVRRNRQQRMTY